MTTIGITDRVLLILRERLRRSEHATTRGTAPVGERAASPHERMEALAAIRDLPDRDFRRAVVRGLLGEQLGEALAADPAFDAMSAEVLRIVEGSDEARAVLDRAVEELRGR
ncbi:hypothetical protein [Sphingomonas phyllosphaerae]|uniref:hypothetical protein n=1 Tax=Sphingomonas phyllosphaerae TaxID=257003 RepID=UPI0003FCD615|nr:hypothetical protein [Sphingomonas phyllosphaerae]